MVAVMLSGMASLMLMWVYLHACASSNTGVRFDKTVLMVYTIIMTNKRISIDLTVQEVAAADAMATLDGMNRKEWIEAQVRDALKRRAHEYLATLQSISTPAK